MVRSNRTQTVFFVNLPFIFPNKKMEMSPPALLVLRILCGRYQSLETLFRASQESFSPCLKDFHLLLHREVLLTCTPLFRVKVRRPCLFSFSFSFHQLLLNTTPKHKWPTFVITAYAHVYNCPLANPGAHCVKWGQVRSAWAGGSVDGQFGSGVYCTTTCMHKKSSASLLLLLKA